MKTYIFDIFNRYKSFSAALDAKSVLANKVWNVFNDEGEKQVYIFQENGTVLITTNGKGTIRKWSYISANNSILINEENNDFVMLHVAFMDKTILAFQPDGTNRYAFLINENNKESFAPKNLKELNTYFLNKLTAEEQDKIEAKGRKLQAENQAEKRQKDMYARWEALSLEEKIKAECFNKYDYTKLFLLLITAIAFAALGVWLEDTYNQVILSYVCAFLALACIGVVAVYFIKKSNMYAKKIEEYKIKHPTDSCIKYL